MNIMALPRRILVSAQRAGTAAALYSKGTFGTDH